MPEEMMTVYLRLRCTTRPGAELTLCVGHASVCGQVLGLRKRALLAEVVLPSIAANSRAPPFQRLVAEYKLEIEQAAAAAEEQQQEEQQEEEAHQST
jgi:hypothetical protein